MASIYRAARDVIIRTEAWEEAKAFYGSVLGLRRTYETETMVGFEAGALCIYVEKGKPHGPVLEFIADDVQAVKRKLLLAGCTIQEEDASAPRCYLRDPYGLVFNIGQGERTA